MNACTLMFTFSAGFFVETSAIGFDELDLICDETVSCFRIALIVIPFLLVKDSIDSDLCSFMKTAKRDFRYLLIASDC